ncbi:hypothetical protein HYPSUDRAFT_33205 [Hypholoma sublateritium FD-334 SS-4]|uniref:Uncharacterized protein n=1 Tax=Hypholoma sublateritium (strain FD-334 SS-4) TaxID=945553 RepID=A0A0D2PKA5_HYPSF|nr:hypothetical protein HYPSUDRAFT_33205 [Hypholoma sublateritium FD-334 SS-4]
MAQHRSCTSNEFRALDLWFDSLSSICFITTVFATIDATLLRIVNSRTPYYNSQAEGTRPANIGLICGLVLYMSASAISFLGGLIVMREKTMLAQRAEQRSSDAFEMRVAMEAECLLTSEDDDKKTCIEETPLSADMGATPAVDSTTVYVWCDLEHDGGGDAAAAERAPSHMCVRLISLLHQMCLLLAMAGVALSFSGIVYEAQIRN